MAPLSGPGPVGAGTDDPSVALEALAAGAVVAIPTETVYGLAARLDRPSALRSLFSLKERPDGVALPVLIGHEDQIDQVAARWPPDAAALTAHFWPGPLTVVVPARPSVGPLLGGEGTSAGLRLPDHDYVRSLCVAAGPLAVTSANRHGQPPAEDAVSVRELFAASPGALAVIVDGGRCAGVASTVLDCTVSPPVCLRHGAVAMEAIEAALSDA